MVTFHAYFPNEPICLIELLYKKKITVKTSLRWISASDTVLVCSFSVMLIIPSQMYYKWLAEETGHYWMIQERQWFSVKHPKKNTLRNFSMSLCLSRLVCNKLRRRLYSVISAKHKTYFVFQRLRKREKPVSSHTATLLRKFLSRLHTELVKNALPCSN